MQDTLSKFRAIFVYTGIFSFFINILTLIPIFYLLQILDRVISSRSNETLAMLTLLVLFSIAIETVLSNLRSRLLNRSSIIVEKMLAPKVLAGLFKSKTQYKHSYDDLSKIGSFLASNRVFAFFDLPWIPFFIFVLYLFHPGLAVIAIAGGGILFILALLEEKTVYKNQSKADSCHQKSVEFLNQSIANKETVAAFGIQDNIIKRWQAMNNEYLDYNAKAGNTSSTVSSMSAMVRSLVKITGLAFGAYLVINENLTAGIMIAANILMGRAMEPMNKAIGSWKSFISVRNAYFKLSEHLNDSSSSKQDFKLPEPKGQLTVDRILFYLSRDRNILNNVGFTLEPGESLGVIGDSASGKTSLARLLVGLYKPNDGFIRLDGADVYQWAQSDLGQYIGYVPQNVDLFSGTIAENIARMGDVEENEPAIVEAAHHARIHDMVLQLPRGYNTETGAGGCFLSGGQRQRIAIARALFGNPKLIVMDEPNSNLDGPAENQLIRLLSELKERDVTVVVISHKPKILSGVDKILALRKGHVKLLGPKEEVMPQVTKFKLIK